MLRFTPAAGSDSPMLSIILPTRNEAANIHPLMDRITKTVCGVSTEVLFVDDSEDDTPQVIREMAEDSPLDVYLIHRSPDCRTNGLGGAVVEGLRQARARWVCVMDADLQHPPENIRRLLELAQVSDSDVVVASRDFAAATKSALGPFRVMVSKVLTQTARLLFRSTLRNVSDPLTGFFLLRRDAVDIDALRPRGFKILLEILVRFPGLRVSEILFEFGSRFAGKSKASHQEVLNYFSLLWHLHASQDSHRLLRFGLVGVTGIVVNSLVLALATEVLGIYYLLSVALATMASTTWNFALTEFWVFGSRQQKDGMGKRFSLFFIVNALTLLVREPAVYLLTSIFGLHYLVSNLVSLGVLMIGRYILADLWIWGNQKEAKPTPKAAEAPSTVSQTGSNPLSAGVNMKQIFHYNIHDIITVVSEVALPELARFMTTTPVLVPTIRVRIDTTNASDADKQTGAKVSGNGHGFRYDEGLGAFGFSARVRLGDTIEVMASPLLRWSPHVLYTNLVEPILRWTFVQKGYALIHAACIAFGDKAYLVTARTDTGKTTTLLKLLSHQRRQSDTASFLSDDLTLVAPDGTVLTYPKPMTISYHTMHAINPELLSTRARLSLALQSRVHSRSGRRAALAVARSRLPMATVNAIVQALIPPPKYHVQQLVPTVKLAREAHLAGMFVIERGEGAEIRLDEREALDILMTNTEDAYGFPPYQSIRGYLYDSNGQNLQAAEREIMGSALRGLPATLLRSKRLAWWQRIPFFVDEHVARYFMDGPRDMIGERVAIAQTDGTPVVSV
jgi:dolichol-phosphate mannosyltransferase